MSSRNMLSMLLVVLGATAGAASAGEPAFARKPSAVKAGAKVTISFAVSTATDVAVAIVNGKGKVVRHLGAAALGGKRNPPPPFVPGLSQNLSWDRTDDAGTPVPPGSYTARVSLGLEAKFHRTIGWNPQTLSKSVKGLAVDDKGNVWLMNRGHSSMVLRDLQMFDREGKYLRTVLPFSSQLPDDRLKGYPRRRRPDGKLVPANIARSPGQLWLTMFAVAVTPDFLYVVGDWKAGVIRTDLDGGRPKLKIRPEGWMTTGMQAFRGCADGQLLIVPLAKSPKAHAVLRVDPEGKPGKAFPSTGKHYLGKPGKAGKDAAHFSNPVAVDVDKGGNIAVADKGNNRVQVFDSSGKLVASLTSYEAGGKKEPLTGLCGVGLAGGGKIVYASLLLPLPKRVRDGMPATGRLIKLDAATGKTVAVLEVTGRVTSRWNPAPPPLLAVDRGAPQPILWVANAAGEGSLWRVEDLGNKLKPREVADRGATGLVSPRGLYLDGAAGRLYIKEYRPGPAGPKNRFWVADAKTGAIKHAPKELNNVADMTLAPDGLWYTVKSGWKIERYDRQWKQVPFPGGKKSLGPVSTVGSSMAHSGLAVDRQGNIFIPVGRKQPATDKLKRSQIGCLARIDVYAPDGTLKQAGFVNELMAPHGVKVDARGNLYVADSIKPLVPDNPWFAKCKHNCRVCDYCYQGGSVLKFPPSGGHLQPLDRKASPPDKGPLLTYYHGANYLLKKGQVLFVGFCPSSERAGCYCSLNGRFDMDAFGRLFIPDMQQFTVHVADSSGNLIRNVGEYGNADCRGPKSPSPRPPIGLFAALVTAVDDQYLYISDSGARRVLQCRLTYAAEEVCRVP